MPSVALPTILRSPSYSNAFAIDDEFDTSEIPTSDPTPIPCEGDVYHSDQEDSLNGTLLALPSNGVERPAAHSLSGGNEPPPAQLTKSEVGLAMLGGILKSPVYVWNDIKAHPFVSAAIFAGVTAGVASGVLNDSAGLVMLAGSATAVWMTGKGVFNSVKAYRTNDRDVLRDAQKDFGVGVFSLMLMGLAVACANHLQSLGALSPADKSQNASLKIFSSVLHCSDEIVAGTTLAKRLASLV